MESRPNAPDVNAPRLTAILGAVLAVGVLAQGAFAGGFLQGHHVWHSWHEALGNALVLPPLISLVVGVAALRRRREPTAVIATRAFLLCLVVTVIVTGHAGRSLLAVHIPAAIAVVGIAVRQATGFVRIPNLAPRQAQDHARSSSAR